MTLKAYYLLSDPDEWDTTEEGYDLAETSLDLELSNHMDCIVYMILDDKDHDKTYIAYKLC